jgi:hypothetical protein
LAGAGLLAFGLRQRRSGGSETEADEAHEDVSADAAAHREQSKVMSQSETNPRGTSGEPDVEVQNDEGNVEFTEEQGPGPSHQPDLKDEAGVEDPRRDHGDETEIDLSEAAMADEASEAVGPSSSQAEPAQTDTVEPERTSEKDSEEMQQHNATDESGEDPVPDADPGEATEEAAEADAENVAEEIIEDEIDDEEREGVETETGATVHTDTNESDNMDIDVDDVTDPDDDLNQESPGSEDSGSHLDEDPPDEDEEE